MSILRCNKCGYIEELPQEALGATRPCPRCETPTRVHDAVQFLNEVIEKFLAMRTELVGLRSAAAGAARREPVMPATSAPESFDINNSAALSTELQHGPILEWFQRRHIRVRTNIKAVDTTGFFDEVATAIGSDYPVLKEVVDRIRFAQMKGFASSTIRLNNKTPEQALRIVEFCRRLYDYSFVAKCFHVKEEGLVRLVLQGVPAIREFFNGEWLEWYVFMAVLEFARRHQRRYSCARNLTITLQNDDTYELDVFFLLDGDRPLCIECKSGEFRQDIDRCLTLRKRLGINRESFIVCSAGLDPKQALGLSSTYDLSFFGEQDLPARLQTMLQAWPSRQ